MYFPLRVHPTSHTKNILPLFKSFPQKAANKVPQITTSTKQASDRFKKDIISGGLPTDFGLILWLKYMSPGFTTLILFNWWALGWKKRKQIATGHFCRVPALNKQTNKQASKQTGIRNPGLISLYQCQYPWFLLSSHWKQFLLSTWLPTPRVVIFLLINLDTALKLTHSENSYLTKNSTIINLFGINLD